MSFSSYAKFLYTPRSKLSILVLNLYPFSHNLHTYDQKRPSKVFLTLPNGVTPVIKILNDKKKKKMEYE